MPAVQDKQSVVETVRTVRRVVEPEYLDTVAAAAFLGVSPITLEKWRTLRLGPPYTSLPRCTRYAVKDLRDFMAKHRIEAEDKPFDTPIGSYATSDRNEDGAGVWTTPRRSTHCWK
jgi:hypothetical protein